MTKKLARGLEQQWVPTHVPTTKARNSLVGKQILKLWGPHMKCGSLGAEVLRNFSRGGAKIYSKGGHIKNWWLSP